MSIEPARMENKTPAREGAAAAAWTKPFAAAWRARAYFLIAFVFWLLSSTVPVPFAEWVPPNRSWWQDLVAKGVGSFDKISYLAFVAGLVYAVASDVFEYVWLNSLQKEVKSAVELTQETISLGLSAFTRGLSSMSHQAVVVWLERGAAQGREARDIAVLSSKIHYGKHHKGEDNLIDFVVDEILDHWGFDSSQTWERFNTHVTIRPSQLPDHFEWEELKSYDVVCPSQSGVLPLLLEGSAKVEPEHVLAALDRLDYKIRFGMETKIDFKPWWAANRRPTLADDFAIEADGTKVSYDGSWLRYSFARDCTISQARTRVVIEEVSYISKEDRCYAIAVRHPTRELQVTLTIEGIPGWTVKDPVASARLYRQGERVVDTGATRSHVGSAQVRGWTLPGLAVVIEWAPKTA